MTTWCLRIKFAHACFFVIVLTAQSAMAEEHSHHEALQCSHKPNAIGAVGVYSAEVHEQATHHLVGGGLFYKRLVVPNWLLIEGAVKVMKGEHGWHVPLEIALRKPLHLGKHVHMAPGIGVSYGMHIHDGKMEDAVWGLGVSLGTSYWIRDWYGLKMELGYGLLFAEKLGQEFVVAAGPVFGW